MTEKEPLVKSEGLMYLDPQKIVRNPQNPRLLFDERSMKILKNSIQEVGVLVPLLVYRRKKDGKHVILDGERRWLCSLDLNKKEIPANVLAEPNMLVNILTMFNIHNVRENWEPMPTALKLEVLMRMLETRNNKILSTHTGLSIGYIARCKKLLTYDKKYQDMMLLASTDERIKTDFFVELYPIFKRINDYLPNTSKKYDRNFIIDTFLKKYQNNIITDVIDFRMLSSMIRAIDQGASKENIEKLIERLLEEPDFSIQDAYEISARAIYDIVELEEVCKALSNSFSQIDIMLLSKRPTSIELLENLKHSIEEILEKLDKS